MRHCCIILAVLTIAAPTPLRAANEIDAARELVRKGQYEDALAVATVATQKNVYFDGWPLLKAEIELTLGRWQDAKATLEAAIPKHNWSIQLRWLAREAYRRAGDEAAADRMQAEILKLAETSPWRFTDPQSLIVLGEVTLDLGADAKAVLESFYDRAKVANPGSREPIQAIGALALAKHDFKLAGATFREGLEKFPDDPDLLYGLAVAVRDSDSAESQKLIQQALTVNPRHIPSLLLFADRQIDAEEYANSRETLLQVLEINPQQDAALAALAVLSHLENQPEQERAFREQALASWEKNPLVDHLIGKKLSQKYRFKEGLAYQRQSLEFDPDYIPARRQAAEDLLRLGEEAEGWALAAGVFQEDAYDVTAYNLVTLHAELEKFATLEDESFLLRMETQEARIYGERVLELLNRAKSTLCAKYGLDLQEQVIVEMFPNPADFEVRTFGMPGVPGFLGVCFGRVITANSPAAQAAGPSNWEAVLWHEFCHVVTLQLTRNRMPRWLSEGISVYEERLADPRWGQTMTPAYRERILGGGLVPITDLSSAFMTPGGDIQFAYYESSLVVEFLVEAYGLEALKAVLADLAVGLPINEALPRHTNELPALEAEFAAFAKVRANAFAPEVDWSTPDLAGILSEDDSEPLLRTWVDEHPTNLRGLMTLAAVQTENERWDDAKQTLRRAIDLSPESIGADSAYLRMAEIHRKLAETDAEAEVLESYALRDADAGTVFLRLMELAREREDWEALIQNAERLMAVNPLTVHPHEGLAKAAEARGDHGGAVRAYRSLLVMSPDDPAELYFRLASHLNALDEVNDARRYVLMALENAPRYREAQRLLLQLAREVVNELPVPRDEPLLPEVEPDAASLPDEIPTS